MSSAGKALLSGLVGFGIAFNLLSADPAPSADKIAAWVEQLGDNDFAVRDRASKALWIAGRAAEEALTKAAKSDDAEVRRRAADILDKFKWGIYPDTPQDVVDLIRRYQGGTAGDKQKAVQDLFARGDRGCSTLVRLARAEEDLNLRHTLFQNISTEAVRAVPKLLADGNFATLDELIDLSLTLRPDDKMQQNHAAYFLLRGKVEERLALFKERATPGKNPSDWQTLAFLHRAKGDLKSAREAAEKTERLDLIQFLLVEGGEWKELSRLAEKQEGLTGPEALGMRAAFHRLAGNADGFDKALIDLRALADERPDIESSWLPTKALLVNAGPAEVLERLVKGERAAVGFDILAAQSKLAEAFAYADKARQAGEREHIHPLKLSQARLHQTLGETEKAAAIFSEYSKKLKENPTASWAADLIKNKARGGLKDQALQDAAVALAAAVAPENQEPLLAAIYPQKRDQAAALWRALVRSDTEAKPAALVVRLDAVLSGKTPKEELGPILEEAGRKSRDLPPLETEGAFMALGEAALTAGLEKLGVRFLEQAGQNAVTPRPFLKLGDLQAARKEWASAAVAYGNAYEKDVKQPLALWLKGWVLAQAGNAEEGRKLMDLAHWQPLGDETIRVAFIKELAKWTGKDFREAQQREIELALKTGQPGSYYHGESARLAAGMALERKDFLKAAEFQERALLRLLTPYTEFIENSPYVTVPHAIHGWRARGLIAAGRIGEARRELEYCQKLMPGHVDLPIQVVAELEKKGEKALAEEVFNKAMTTNTKVCQDYPNSAVHHNNLAWLCACCRRDLDLGLKYAQTAVRLTPENAGHLDTLAEVHFQRGDKDKAIEFMKKCIANDGQRPYYRKQLQRFEAGDRTADIPTTGAED